MKEQEAIVVTTEVERETVDVSPAGEVVDTSAEVLLEREVIEPSAVDEERETHVTTQDIEREVVSAGSQGPAGAQGPIGPAGGSAFERTSADAISALRVVWEDEDGVVRPLDYLDTEHIDLLAGITITSALGAGLPVTVQRSGVIDASGLGLVPGRVWLGVDGQLTQTPPADGFDVFVGSAVSNDRLLLLLQDNIELE